MRARQANEGTLAGHIEHPNGVALWGPLIGLVIVAVFCGLIAIFTPATGLWFVAAIAAGICGWWAFTARAKIQIDKGAVRFSAPLFSRRVLREEIAGVSVQEDDGMSHGFINWPVSHVWSKRVTRINMGGAASVTVSVVGGSSVQFVVRTLQDANRLARVIQG
ncbi:hypothetical protein [Leucobacter chinensis]|uniref:hypothetical protein n=1 Tax=Leucobacter chinensis TaxID=2851010 RepID=UPI001C239969|nr:hypothetical protein [Leucobacter chinensis]